MVLPVWMQSSASWALCVLPVQVVAVVRRHDGDACVLCQPEEFPVHLLLLGDPVVLELEVEILLAEDLLVFEGDPLRVVIPVLDEQRRDLAAEAGREADKPFSVGPQQFLVDPRLVVESFEISGGHELDQVLVALSVAGEEYEVIGGFRVRPEAGVLSNRDPGAT